MSTHNTRKDNSCTFGVVLFVLFCYKRASILLLDFQGAQSTMKLLVLLPALLTTVLVQGQVNPNELNRREQLIR